jgi:hypothetical protein
MDEPPPPPAAAGMDEPGPLLSNDLDEDAMEEMDEPWPPPTAAGMDEPRPLLSNDLDEDGVQEIVQRTWPQYMQGSTTMNGEQVFGHNDDEVARDEEDLALPHEDDEVVMFGVTGDHRLEGEKEERFSCLLRGSSCFCMGVL